MGRILNHLLADEFALSATTRDYHWNVSGPQSRSLQELFDEQHRQLDRWSERIGERVRALGLAAKTGWRELVQARRFRPAPGAGLSADEMMAALVALHEYLAAHLQRDTDECAGSFGDPVTAGLLAELAEYHETTAWMLGELRNDRERVEA
ncbi:MAG TPA: DNA starvation/stationary phase protection protein [Opitutus sp.]|nr:DNA starvation/stationary phase protection protein [Opitutus sp.]